MLDILISDEKAYAQLANEQMSAAIKLLAEDETYKKCVSNVINSVCKYLPVEERNTIHANICCMISLAVKKSITISIEDLQTFSNVSTKMMMERNKIVTNN